MTPSDCAVVTGAGNGIGRGIALALADRGCTVVVSDIVLAEAEQVAREIAQRGGQASALACDVSRTPDVEALVRQVVAAHGVPRLVFSNAGVAVDSKPVLQLTKDDWRWLLDVNLLGAWDVGRAFAQAALDAGAPMRIVFTASEHSLGYPHRGMGAYTASKHALLGLAEAFRGELAGRVGVSVCCPGLVNSRLWEAQRHRPGFGPPASKQGAAVMEQGRDPLDVGRLIVERAERGDFMIVTHPHAKRFAQRRWQEVEAAFDSLEQDHPGIGDYDVEVVVTRMRGAR